MTKQKICGILSSSTPCAGAHGVLEHTRVLDIHIIQIAKGRCKGVIAVKSKTEMIRDEMSERIIEAAQNIVAAAGELTVRDILKRLNITNRVFYNRFHNIGEVLAIVYKNTALRVRESISANIDSMGREEFFEHINAVLTNVLTISYDTKKGAYQHLFESDSITRSELTWWTGEIAKMIEYAKSRGYIKDIDSEAMSYSIWCFCRGYSTDAVSRDLPRERAIENFKYSFSILLDGMKK